MGVRLVRVPISLLVLACSLLLLLPLGASAHAAVVSTDPMDGAPLPASTASVWPSSSTPSASSSTSIRGISSCRTGKGSGVPAGELSPSGRAAEAVDALLSISRLTAGHVVISGCSERTDGAGGCRVRGSVRTQATESEGKR